MEHIQAALPFARAAAPASPAAPRLSLQAYAALHAERAVAPQRAGEILRKYELADEAAYRALEDEWRARFAAQPEAQREWQRLCASYRELLLRQGR